MPDQNGLPTEEEVILQDLNHIFDTTQEYLASAIADMVNEGKTVQDVKDAILQHGTFSSARALGIARTTAGTATSLGQLKSGIAAGATHKTWHDSGFHTRPEHVARNGETVPIDERFSRQFGEALGPMYPGDPSIPLADRINCRCYMTFSIQGGAPVIAPTTVQFDTSTPIGAWNEASYSNAPDAVITQLNSLKFTYRATAKKTAFYNPEYREIGMYASAKRTSLAQQATWRHETGHALDNQLSGDVKDFISAKQPYKSSKFKDNQALSAARKANIAKAPVLLKTEAEISSKLAELGVDENALDSWLESHTNLGSKSSAIQLKKKSELVAAWETGDAQLLVDSFVTSIKSDPGWQKGSIPVISDLAGATTNNRVCDYTKGYAGHAPQYYQQNSKLAGTEAFANVNALYSSGDPFEEQVLDRFFPNQKAAYLEAIDGS